MVVGDRSVDRHRYAISGHLEVIHHRKERAEPIVTANVANAPWLSLDVGQRKVDDSLLARFEGFEGAKGASPEAVAKIEEVFGRKLPDSLREILLEADGLGGVIGDHELQIWSAEEIVAYNRSNRVQEDCPAFLMFGSDGGGEAYTLDYRTAPPSVVLVAAIGFDYESAIPIGRDFVSFLDRLKDPRSLFDR